MNQFEWQYENWKMKRMERFCLHLSIYCLWYINILVFEECIISLESKMQNSTGKKALNCLICSTLSNPQIIRDKILTAIFSVVLACSQDGCQISSPCMYISSPSPKWAPHREQRAQVGWNLYPPAWKFQTIILWSIMFAIFANIFSSLASYRAKLVSIKLNK